MRAMTQSLISVGLFVLLLALIPVGLKWVQRRSSVSGGGAAMASKVISAVAVGPHQRVVTVEVGPEDARIWLTLGVTAQTITCLHSAALAPRSAIAAPTALACEPGQT